MSSARIIALLCVAGIVISIFFPFISIPSKDIEVTGLNSAGTSFGKPGLIYLIVSSILIILLLTGKVWSYRIAFFISVINLAWSLRNYVFLSACMSGICPEKHLALYADVILSIMTSVAITRIRVQPRSVLK